MKKQIILIVVLVLVLAAIAVFSPTRVPEPTPTPSPTPTSTPSSILSEADARQIAESSCIKGGESIELGMRNGITKTWWFDANLNSVKPGCNPACVVSEETKTAEINWRCTGLSESVPPAPVQMTCAPADRLGDVCAEIYAPVCATVAVQCIKAPCPPVEETFSSSCFACHNSLVESYTEGECVKK